MLIKVESPVLGFGAYRRNFLINGGCVVQQRQDTSIGVTYKNYGPVDRFFALFASSNAGNLGTLTGTSNDVFNAASGAALVCSGVTTPVPNSILVGQRIEGRNSRFIRYALENSLGISLQVKMIHNSPYSCNVLCSLATPTGLDTWAAAPVAIYNSTVQSVPPNAWKTIKFENIVVAPDNIEDGLQAVFRIYNQNTWSNVSISFADMQLEIGPIATPFEYRPFAQELALCQRYYEMAAARKYLAACYAGSYVQNQEVVYVVTKRIDPTVTLAGIGFLGPIGTSPVLYNTTVTARGHSPIFTSTAPTVGAAGQSEFSWTADAEL